MRRQALLLGALCVLGVRVDAKPTDPGQITIWDQMMEAQAARDLHEGYQRMEAKDYERAVKEFAKAVISNPGDAMGHLMLGSAYYWLGNVERLESLRDMLSNVAELNYPQLKERFEREFLIRALKAFDGRVNQTAEHTQMTKVTLLRKLEKYGIDPKQYHRH